MISKKLWQNRIAAALIFFSAGFIGSSWVARLPELQTHLNISNTITGTLLLCLSGGSIAFMPFVAWFSVKFGSKRIVAIAAVLNASFLILLAVSPSVTLLVFLFLIWGALMGAMDVTVNGQAVLIEREWKKPIMSSFHAMFSLGTVLGSLGGSFFAGLQISFFIHFLLSSIFCLILILWAIFHLFEDTKKNFEPLALSNEPNSFELLALSNELSSEINSKLKVQNSFLKFPSRAILPIALIGFCGMTGEATMIDWSAVYMNKVAMSSASISALALSVNTFAMLIGRLAGDWLTQKFGKRQLLIFNTLISIFGLSLALIFHQPYAILAGFFIIGLGLSSTVPIVYSIAGNLPNIEPSVGLAMVTTISYAGFFLGPPIIGFLSDVSSLPVAFCYTLILFCTMLYLIIKQKF